MIKCCLLQQTDKAKCVWHHWLQQHNKTLMYKWCNYEWPITDIWNTTWYISVQPLRWTSTNIELDRIERILAVHLLHLHTAHSIKLLAINISTKFFKVILWSHRMYLAPFQVLLDFKHKMIHAHIIKMMSLHSSFLKKKKKKHCKLQVHSLYPDYPLLN